MANVLLYNLAAMTVTTTGTGTITLGSAARINGVLFLSFASAGISNGDTVAYFHPLDPAGASEVGFWRLHLGWYLAHPQPNHLNQR